MSQNKRICSDLSIPSTLFGCRAYCVSVKQEEEQPGEGPRQITKDLTELGPSPGSVITRVFVPLLRCKSLVRVASVITRVFVPLLRCKSLVRVASLITCVFVPLLRCKSVMKVACAKLHLITPQEVNMEEYEVDLCCLSLVPTWPTTSVCVHVCECVCVFVCVCVCKYVCVWVCVYGCIYK